MREGEAAGGQSFNRFLIALLAIGFAALIATGIGAVWTINRNVVHTGWVNHTYEVELAIQRMTIANEQAEGSRRGYLLTANPLGLSNYEKAAAALDPALTRLATLTADNPREQRNIAALRALLTTQKAHRIESNTLISAGRRADAQAAFAAESGPKIMLTVRALGQRMVAEERRLLALRDADLQRSVRTFYIILGVAGAILLLVAVISFVTIRRYTLDLGASRDALQRLNDSLEEQVAERTADLLRANEEIQRFAYIVSHDLRAPLVNVMGFTAELGTATAAIGELIDRAEEIAPAIVTEEARLAAREDLPEAIGFIRTSTQKMDRLINAILTLSRQGRRVLTPERLDIAAMVETIRDSLIQILDARGTTVSIDGALPGIVSDRLAIEQILSNLIENAAKYLAPGRPGRIVVRGGAEGARRWIEIEDNGRGIPTADHERVFDLFRRSGAQDQPGEGIGLAHVRALAYRLGGTVTVRSVLGEGATFRLSLPHILQETAS